ncbi:MAG: hypothetical protein HC853_11290 [Anaerolineae bacterium]|nr:hypothetical protein [Anaerolineae bacterium]
MISIFNGRRRSLGSADVTVFAQLSVEFRKYLHLFKGARMHIFLCIALHADEKGWAYPGIETCLKRETGYNRQTIILALNDLCSLVIEGQRVLLAYQPVNGDGSFQPNQYLIFPTSDEVDQYETQNPRRRQAREKSEPSVENPYSVQPSVGFPYTGNPNSENPHSKKNQSEPKPNSYVADDDGDFRASRYCAQKTVDEKSVGMGNPGVLSELIQALQHYGIDEPIRLEIARSLTKRAFELDGVGEWRKMTGRIINCWRACFKKASRTRRHFLFISCANLISII